MDDMTDLEAARHASVKQAVLDAVQVGATLVVLNAPEEVAVARKRKYRVCECDAHSKPHLHVKRGRR